MRVLDPTFEETATGFAPALRLEGLRGTTIGIISNGKEGTVHFFAHLERVLRDRFGVATVRAAGQGQPQRAGRTGDHG